MAINIIRDEALTESALLQVIDKKDDIDAIGGLKAKLDVAGISGSEFTDKVVSSIKPKPYVYKNAINEKGTNLVDVKDKSKWTFYSNQDEKYTVVNEDTYYGDTYLEYKETSSKSFCRMQTVCDFSLLGKESISLYIAPSDKLNWGNITLSLLTKNGGKFYVFCKEMIHGPANAWITLKIPISEFVAANGAVIKDVIKGITFDISSTKGTVENPSIWKLGGIVLDQIPRTAITFSFDDAVVTDYTVVFKKFRQLNWKATSFIISSLIDTPYGGERLSLLQMQEMKEYGWLFGIHGDTGLNWVEESTIEVAEQSIKLCRDYLYDNDLVTEGVTSCAYPHGQFTDEIIAILKRYGVTLSRTTNVVYQNSPVEDMMRLSIGCGHLSRTLQENIDKLEEAISRGGLINIYGHRMADDGISVSPAVFNGFMDYIYNNYNHLVTDLSTWQKDYEKGY